MTNSTVTIHSKKVPILILMWLGLEVLNVILSIITVILMLVPVASRINPIMVEQMSDSCNDTEVVTTGIWATSVLASGIYIAATGQNSSVKGSQAISFTNTEVVKNIFTGPAFQLSPSTSGLLYIATTMT